MDHASCDFLKPHATHNATRVARRLMRIASVGGFVFLGSLGCSGGAVGTSSGASGGATDASQTIAEELFKAPDPNFDDKSIDGLYQTSSFSVAPIRVRISPNAIAIAHKTESGTFVGAQTNAQISETAPGSAIWKVVPLEAARGTTSEPCVERLIKLSLLARTFTLSAAEPGQLTGYLPIVVVSQSCGTGGTTDAAASVSEAVLEKIGK